MADLFDIVVARKLSGGGGGGSSDFSTAKATITLPGGLGGPQVFVSVAQPDALLDGDASSYFVPESGTYDVILYKGKGMGRALYPDGDVPTVAVTGNAEATNRGNIVITGDCTITVTAS